MTFDAIAFMVVCMLSTLVCFIFFVKRIKELGYIDISMVVLYPFITLCPLLNIAFAVHILACTDFLAQVNLVLWEE